MRKIVAISVGSLSIVVATAAAAQQHDHSAGERLGTVHFSTSCKPAVTAQFDRAVALLHSFEFGASIRAFSEVLATDSSCAMAYWGLALSRWSNPIAAGFRSPAQLESGRQAVDAGLRVGVDAPDRERMYLAAVSELYRDYERQPQAARQIAYKRAMGELSAKFPADTEAMIFHAIALTAAAPPTDKTYADQLQAGKLLEQLWARQPDHPGLAHYIIHTYDVPALADHAAAAARRYAVIAPSAAHAQHMPSHTFTRVGEWQLSVEANRRSGEIALRSASIAEALHASDYAAYAHLQMGHDSAAKAILDGLPALEARFDVNAVTGAAPGSAGVFAIAAIPARYALERRDWTAAAALVPKTSGFPWTEAMVHFARSLGASHSGDTSAARAGIDSVVAIRDRLSRVGEAYWAEQVAIQALGAAAWLDLVQRRADSALTRMREAATREDATDKNAVTPGPLAPARELLGDMLMELNRPREALSEYRATLTKEPNRFRALYGAMRAASLSGDRDAAGRYRALLRTLTAGADRPGRPELRQIR
jgi:hypothetical protein